MIELTEKQVQALQTSEKPPCLVNRQTQETFVLLATKEYERLIGDQADRNPGQKQREYDDERVRLSVQPIQTDDIKAWLERIEERHKRIIAERGYFPDSAISIAEDRAR